MSKAMHRHTHTRTHDRERAIVHKTENDGENTKSTMDQIDKRKPNKQTIHFEHRAHTHIHTHMLLHVVVAKASESDNSSQQNTIQKCRKKGDAQQLSCWNRILVFNARYYFSRLIFFIIVVVVVAVLMLYGFYYRFVYLCTCIYIFQVLHTLIFKMLYFNRN